MIAAQPNHQISQGIEQSILPMKSKACRSYSTNNQSLDQIMKKANEIIRKSKNSCAAQELMNSKGLHGLGESFFALPTADSLQKNGNLSTNRECIKVSPFVTAASPETTADEDNHRNIIFSSGNNNNKTFESCEKSDRSSSQQYQDISQHHPQQQQTPRVLSEADYFFENFDNLVKVSFNNNSINQLNESSAAQNSGNNSVIRSLLGTFEKIRKEQQQQQQQQQSILNQIASSAYNPGSQPSSYLVPKSTQQTAISPYQLLPPTPSSSSNHHHSQSQYSQQSQQQSICQLPNESLDQYLKKPQPAKVKQTSVYSAAHPPLPQNAPRHSLQHSNNQNHAQNFYSNNCNNIPNSARYRQRHSLQDKENNGDSANSNSFSSNNNNNNNSYYNYGQSQIVPLMSSSSGSRQQQPNSQYIFTTPTTAHIQPIQTQGNNAHQRSSSYIIEGTQNYPPSNSLANSLGYSRPRSDSNVIGPPEILLPEPHLRTNGTYAPLKTKSILNIKPTDTPQSVRLSSSSNGSNMNNNQVSFATQRNSMQINNLPSGYHGIPANKGQNHSLMLNNLISAAQKQNQNSIQSGAAYQLTNTNSNSQSSSISQRSTSVPKQVIGTQYLLLKK